MQPLFLGYRGFSAPIRLYSCINWPFYALCHLPRHLFWGGSPRNDENQSRIRLISSGGAATGARSYLCAPRRRPKPTKKSLKCHKNWQLGNLASFGLFYLGLVWLVFGLVWTFTVGLFLGWFWELSPRFSRIGPGNPENKVDSLATWNYSSTSKPTCTILHLCHNVYSHRNHRNLTS